MRILRVVLAIALASPGPSLAADPRYPDWPCNQIKVPEMSVAAVWAGPPIDDVESIWEQDPAVRNLVAQLAARRTRMRKRSSRAPSPATQPSDSGRPS